MSKTIVFFGSGPVAARSLELLSRNFEVETVITKPQPLHHKAVFPVLQTAKRLGLTVQTGASTQEMTDLFRQNQFSSQIGVIIDHGLIVKQEVIDHFPMGIINSHFSLLPKWRGADPISFAILNGDNETGVSLMLINERLDEGNLLAQQSIKLDHSETTPSLTQKLIELSDTMLSETIPKYLTGTVSAYPQPSQTPSYSHKLSKKDGLLDWRKPAVELEREIRAFLDWPRSRTTIGGIDIVVSKARVVHESGTPGNISTKNGLLGIYCADDLLIIERLIPSGRKEMTALEFLNGYRINTDN